MQKYATIGEYDKILLKSKSILKEYTLCDYCLGRFFIKSTNLSSSRRLGCKLKYSLNFKTSTKGNTYGD